MFCLWALILIAYDRQSILRCRDSADKSSFEVHKDVITLLSLNLMKFQKVAEGALLWLEATGQCSFW